MKAIAVEAEEKIDELLLCLDEDIRHIRDSLLRLDELRSLVVRRDDVALGRLLESIRAELDSYKSHELKRQSLREELAVAFGCNLEEITLSRLEAVLSGERKAQVVERKSKLRLLTVELKKEHLGTMMLLSDCARFNGVLLRSVFELGKTGTITYNSSGSAKRQTDMALVNLQF
jgi:hypothetical protein